MASEKDQTFTPQDEQLNQTNEVCNNFANDGSFLEFFRKKMDQQKSETVDVTAEKRDESCGSTHSPTTTTSQSHDSTTRDISKEKNKPYQVVFTHPVTKAVQMSGHLILCRFLTQFHKS